MAELVNSKYDKRVIFPLGKQHNFLLRVKNTLGCSWEKLADITGAHKRTLNDWKREKYSISLRALRILSREAGIAIPKSVLIKEPFWYVSKGARIGGFAVYKKYGRIGGDVEYWRKKWHAWWEREGRYQKHPIIGITKPIRKPRFSKELAEFVGIIMGDGGITKWQVTVTINSQDDRKYGYFTKKLIQKLFKVPAAIRYHKNQLTMSIVVSRKELVDFCHKNLGLKIGNKLEQGLDIPNWIKENIEFQKAFLRGLIDTDGCIFNEIHKINGKIYSYQRLNFTSAYPQLRKSVFSIFQRLHTYPKLRGERSVQIENKEEIRKYFESIGTHNPKHKRRFMEGYG